MDKELKEALEAVIKEAPSTGYNDYAKSYAVAALKHPDKGGVEMGGEELRVQLLYVLNNLHYWKDGEQLALEDRYSSNHDLPALPKQTKLLYHLTGKDYRDSGLTRGEAGRMIRGRISRGEAKWKS